MSLIEKFAQMVSQTDGFFVLGEEKEGDRFHLFTQVSIGAARFVYGADGRCKNRYSNIGIYLGLKLKAIVANGNVYVIDECAFGLISRTGHGMTLPQNVYRMADLVRETNERVRSVIFPEFYRSLEEKEYKEGQGLAQAKLMARKVLLSARKTDADLDLKPLMDMQDIADYLCGSLNIEEEALRRLNDGKASWLHIKSLNHTAEKLIDGNQVAEPYELQFANSIKDLDAKMVTVDFERNGRCGTAKISRNKLLQKLIDRDHFSYYDFETAKCGKELMKDFAAAGGDGDHMLTCQDISRITYGKKTIYQREG